MWEQGVRGWTPNGQMGNERAAQQLIQPKKVRGSGLVNWTLKDRRNLPADNEVKETRPLANWHALE